MATRAGDDALNIHSVLSLVLKRVPSHELVAGTQTFYIIDAGSIPPPAPPPLFLLRSEPSPRGPLLRVHMAPHEQASR